ncbi:hypothetical protein ColTof4_10887 [Colletotrichum tofieldiae]|nr:hypothetical protein ColTof3_07004 [Colletotrichum tofieldiae]GKT78464.1 hypothetical protein ColTof4_10887 [Colletotrichum tofieldiae]
MAPGGGVRAPAFELNSRAHHLQAYPSPTPSRLNHVLSVTGLEYHRHQLAVSRRLGAKVEAVGNVIQVRIATGFDKMASLS